MTRLKRAPARGTRERQTLYDILDASPLCHVGHVIDGRPVVTPTCHWRIDDDLYWHGSRISRMIEQAENHDVCVTVTHLDGLVLARSAFHHSANYRSAMVFGRPVAVAQDADKLAALEGFIDRLFPDRWNTLRPVNRKELAATTVLRLPITEASAKIRQGPPMDDADDLDWPAWAGVVPTRIQAGTPVTSPEGRQDVAAPAVLQGLFSTGQ